MSVQSTSQGIHESMRTLSVRWSEAREHWDDATSDRFYRDHLEGVEESVRAAMSALSRIGDALQRARAECDEHD